MNSMKIQDLIHEYLKTDITISQMAQELNVDEHTVCQFDIYGIGIDPNDYEKALKKLESEHQQLKELRHRRTKLMFRRIDLGLSESEVARKMGMTTFQFQYLEMCAQHQPTAKEIEDFEKALDALTPQK